MMQSLLRSFLLIVLLTSLAIPARAGEIVEGEPSDQSVTASGVNVQDVSDQYAIYCGTVFGLNANVVEPFQLPYLAPGQTITGATISFYLNSQTSTPNLTVSSPNYNLSLYALKRVSTTYPATPLATDYYLGTSDSNNTLLTSSFVTATTPVNSTVSYSGAALTTFINSQYANTAFSGLGLNSPRYVFFRINANVDVQNNGFSNYLFGSSRNPTRTEHPTLALTISGGITNVAGRLQFSFNLPEDSTTSAGVYNPTTGVLVRTLWNNVRYQAGNNYGYWDGNDDNGNALPAGNYQIKLIHHNVQYIWDGMLGNTSANQNGTTVYRAFSVIHDMSISGNTAFYSVGYNELEGPFKSFTVGAPQVPSDLNFGYTLSDPYSNFSFVASDGTRSYWAKVFGGIVAPDGDAGAGATFVVAITSSTNKFYTFPKGTTLTEGSFQKYPSCVDYDPTPNQPNAATGIAVQQKGNCLFVAHGTQNVVRVFDKVQGNLLGTFNVTYPGRMSCTANGDVWVTSGGATPSVMRYTFANGTATLDQTLTGFSNPIGVGVSPDDSLVVVTDGGTSQQVKAFNNSTGTSLWTYGLLGGNPVNGPAITTNCFDFNVQEANVNLFYHEAFVAFQPDGTFWLEDEGNHRVLHFSITGSTLTYIEQIAYTDASYRSTVDLTNPTRVFNNFIEYAVNYSLPLGGTNGSWTMVNNWEVGLPNDATHNYIGFANGWISVVTMPNGRTYGFIENEFNLNSDLFELPATGPARFTGYSFPNGVNPLLYADGTLRYNVENGADTTISYYSQPLTGYDSSNNPVWGSPQLLASDNNLNPAVDPIPWNAFPERTEVTANGSVIDFDGNFVNTGFHLAALGVGGSTFKWHASPCPVNLVATYNSTNTTATLNWSDAGDGISNSGITNFTVQKSTDGGTTWTTVSTVSNTTFSTTVAVTPGTNYQFQVLANNADGTKLSFNTSGPFWFPQDGKFDIANGVQYAGNYALALDRNIVYGYHGEFWKGGEASQWVNYLDNGLMVGRFGTYESAVGAAVTVDGFAGNSFSPTLVHGPNGTVYLYHNDEANHGGTCRWQITGWDDITEMDGTGAVGSTTTLSASTDGPTVSLTSPTAAAVYSNGSNVNLSAEAASSGASITSVQFMDGTTSLGSVSSAPFALAYSGLSTGSHVITAVATDSNGLTATSPPITITIGSDGTSASPPAPVSLSTSAVSSSSVTLNWTEPAIGTTSSTIGQIISFQFDSAGDAHALKPTDVAGAAPYTSANFNLLGITSTGGITFINPLNNAGTTVANLGLDSSVGGSSSSASTQSLTGTASKLFSTEVTTQYGSAIVGVSVSAIPFAQYDLVLYSLPGNLNSAASTVTTTVSSALGSSTITQNFTKGQLPTGYTTGTVAFGSNTTVSGVNTIVVQGLTSPLVEIQGTNLAGFQIVERPYDQGTPTSYTIQRATGANGTFTTVGTASGSATSFTDTSVSASTTYQYAIQAVNSYGTSASSNSVTVTTPAAPTPATTSFGSWQAEYFTAEQLADPTISGATADPYGSGVPNLLAYALQLNPATARPTDVPSPVIVNGHLTVTYFIPNTITDITYTVQVSPDLINWNSGAGYTQTISSVVGATGTTITVQDALPASTQKHFMRLLVTQNQ